MNNYIDGILNDLINNGSSISYLKELRSNIISLIKKDLGLEDSLNELSNKVVDLTSNFLYKNNSLNIPLINAISTGIYFSDNDSFYKLIVLGGVKKRGEDNKIDLNTVFDVASITKLYTLILLYKLEELGLINLNDKVSSLNKDFLGLDDFTLNDLVRLHGQIKTLGNIADCKSINEAKNILKTAYLYSSDRTKNKYNDFGALIIGDTICKVVSSRLNKDLSFDEILKMFLFNPNNINNTLFLPESNYTGNERSDNFAHDPKSRVLGGVSSHAGLFTNSGDLFKLSDVLYNGYLNSYHINKLCEQTFPFSSKGNLGNYVKHEKGWEYTYTPNEFSNLSFASQGYTGSLSVFDVKNRINNNILVSSIYNDKEITYKDKLIGFKEYFSTYQIELTKIIMNMYVIKKYYNDYVNTFENINKTLFLK